MEVHSHTHTPRKKWTHYLWEFLMLFLAVFCGFLAENQREHMIEGRREKKYMQTMVEDLQTDVLQVNEEIQFARSQLEITDTLMDIVDNRNLDPENMSKLYKLHFSQFLVGPYFEDRTSAQLKNAGGLRLIHEKQVADSLSGYWHSIKICETMTQLYEEYSKKATDVSVRIFNHKYVTAKETWKPPSEINPQATFISSQPALLDEYSNRMYIKRNLLRMFIERMERTSRYATGLIDIIRKEYHLN